MTMALRWCVSRWYVGSTIIGATSMAQLKQNLDAFEADAPPLPQVCVYVRERARACVACVRTCMRNI